MSKAWPLIRLGEVLRLDPDRVNVDAASTYPMVGVLSFGRGLFDREPIENGKTSYKFFCRLKAEHVVMSQLFGWEGALALSSERFAGKFLSPQFPTFLCDESKLERRFLGWLMRRPVFWEDLGTRASGIGDRRRTLTPEALFACQIALPPLREQGRIVARIDELAAKINEACGLLREVESESEALCRSMIFSGSPEYSKQTPMREFLRLREPHVAVQPEETYRFAGVYCFGGGVFRGQTKTGAEFAYRRLTCLRTGDFVYPKLMAWEGALGVVPTECDGLFVSPEFPVFEINQERALPDTLDVYFRTPSVWPLLSAISTGTNVRRRRLNPDDFLRFEMPLPPMHVQRKVREVKAKTEVAKKMRMETAAEFDALLPSILDKAFKGEL